VIFCEALAIYGVIIAIISATKLDPKTTMQSWIESTSSKTQLTFFGAGNVWDPQALFPFLAASASLPLWALAMDSLLFLLGWLFLVLLRAYDALGKYQT